YTSSPCPADTGYSLRPMVSLLVVYSFEVEVGFRVDDRHLRAGNNRPARIGDVPYDGCGACGLREGRRCGQQPEDRKNDSSVHPIATKGNSGSSEKLPADAGKHILHGRA